MILSINPLLPEISCIVMDSHTIVDQSAVAKNLNTASTLPRHIVDLVDKYDITEIWCIVGPAIRLRSHVGYDWSQPTFSTWYRHDILPSSKPIPRSASSENEEKSHYEYGTSSLYEYTSESLQQKSCQMTKLGYNITRIEKQWNMYSQWNDTYQHSRPSTSKHRTSHDQARTHLPPQRQRTCHDDAPSTLDHPRSAFLIYLYSVYQLIFPFLI